MSPDVNGDGGTGFIAIAAEGGGEGERGVVAADGVFVDVGLDYGRPDHGCGAGEESCCDSWEGMLGFWLGNMKGG